MSSTPRSRFIVINSRANRGTIVRTLAGPEGRLVGTITTLRRSSTGTTTPEAITVLAYPGDDFDAMVEAFDARLERSAA